MHLDCVNIVKPPGILAYVRAAVLNAASTASDICELAESILIKANTHASIDQPDR